MSEAPERIWAGMVTTQHYPLVIQRLWDVERFGDKTGYVRADLYEQRGERIAELEASRALCHKYAGCVEGNCLLDGDECAAQPPQEQSNE